jgi:hypothetical protein
VKSGRLVLSSFHKTIIYIYIRICIGQSEVARYVRGSRPRVSTCWGISYFLPTEQAKLTFVSSQQEYLLISDPKTLQYIYHTSGYKYAKHKERAAVVGLVGGKGLAAVDGACVLPAHPTIPSLFNLFDAHNISLRRL